MSDRVSRAEAARQIGVSPSTVTRLIQANPELLDHEGEVSVAEIIELRRTGQVVVRSAKADLDRTRAAILQIDLAERLATTLRRDDVEAAIAKAETMLRRTAADLVAANSDRLTGITDAREMERALEDVMREFLAGAAAAMCAGETMPKGDTDD